MMPLLDAPTMRARITDAAWWSWCIIAPVILLCLPRSLFAGGPDPVATPSVLAADWQANPQAALQAVLADNHRLIESFNALVAARQTDWVGWAVGAVGLGVGFLKVFNGPAGALAEMLWAGIAPRFVKDAEKKRDVMADGFLKVAAVMRSFPPNTPLGDVIDKLDRRLPEGVKTAYREWEAHEASDRPTSVPVAPLVRGT